MPAGTVSDEVVPGSEAVVRMTPAPELLPTPTHVGELPAVQAQAERFCAPDTVVDDQVDPVPPQAADAPVVPLPLVIQVTTEVPGAGHPLVDAGGRTVGDGGGDTFVERGRAAPTLCGGDAHRGGARIRGAPGGGDDRAGNRCSRGRCSASRRSAGRLTRCRSRWAPGRTRNRCASGWRVNGFGDSGGSDGLPWAVCWRLTGTAFRRSEATLGRVDIGARRCWSAGRRGTPRSGGRASGSSPRWFR